MRLYFSAEGSSTHTEIKRGDELGCLNYLFDDVNINEIAERFLRARPPKSKGVEYFGIVDNSGARSIQIVYVKDGKSKMFEVAILDITTFDDELAITNAIHDYWERLALLVDKQRSIMYAPLSERII